MLPIARMVLTSLAIARVKRNVESLVAYAASLALAAVLAAVALGFLLSAGWIWLATQYGSMTASLIIGGAFVLLALVMYAVALIRRSHGRRDVSPLAAAPVAASRPRLPASTRSLMPVALVVAGGGYVLGRLLSPR